jgi:phospholysine phosphohistidine inorganic pyrophosphate phosphatase
LPDAFLLDLDGTLYSGAGPVPGAVAAVAALHDLGLPFRFLTNTTSRSRAGIVRKLQGFGFAVTHSQIQTPIVVATALARAEGITALVPFVGEEALEDLAGFELLGRRALKDSLAVAGGREGGPPTRPPGGGGGGGGAAKSLSTRPPVRPPAVLIGDLGAQWSYALMQEAFEYLDAGARFLALSRDRYFYSAEGLRLDAGPFVAALEYATGREATVVGKPSAAYYAEAVAGVGATGAAGRVAMVGDDLWSDVQGAQQAGCQGWLVRTGKFREEALRQSGVTPDRIIDSIADLAGIAGGSP